MGALAHQARPEEDAARRTKRDEVAGRIRRVPKRKWGGRSGDVDPSSRRDIGRAARQTHPEKEIEGARRTPIRRVGGELAEGRIKCVQKRTQSVAVGRSARPERAAAPHRNAPRAGTKLRAPGGGTPLAGRRYIVSAQWGRDARATNLGRGVPAGGKNILQNSARKCDQCRKLSRDPRMKRHRLAEVTHLRMSGLSSGGGEQAAGPAQTRFRVKEGTASEGP
ncbi:hypothetical protein B0H15DRAFT_804516 [Mycena belliarum]|uniref:Uncharacterized protein n=1 Tax=Mycena belliarum TaxID=1033014 RepID=A0AAD6XHF3_9AGAR|nr:hypothetical protein B0H15DRAFT_804516 [Mycena belliae]